MKQYDNRNITLMHHTGRPRKDGNYKEKRERTPRAREMGYIGINGRTTDQEIQDALITEKGFLYRAAARLHIKPETLSKRIKETPDLLHLLFSIHGQNIDAVESNLITRALDGDTRSAELYLNARAKDRGYGKGNEIGGINVNIGNAAGIKLDISGAGEQINPIELSKQLLQDCLNCAGLMINHSADQIQASKETNLIDAEIVNTSSKDLAQNSDVIGEQPITHSAIPFEPVPLAENRGVNTAQEADLSPLPTKNSTDVVDPPPLFVMGAR